MGEICKQVSVGFVCHHISLTPQVAKTMCYCETRRGEVKAAEPVIMGLRIRSWVVLLWRETAAFVHKAVSN